jgi:glycosyltransferase involved in cell wall biosynthesis
MKYEKMGCWKFLGNLSQQQLAAFYPNIDVLVVSSLNSTEAFGLVQVEAMMNNVPCVASDLPGVRQPVLTTGMGRIVPVGDATSISKAIKEIIKDPSKYQGDSKAIAKTYDPDSIVIEYEKIFEKLLRK